jgi:acetolactate decarboxylase
LRKQTPPFKSLADAAKTEEIITVKNVEGTLVGYWFPQYLAGVAVPEFHLHFINKTRTLGGHVLELDLLSGTLNLEQIDDLNIYFPKTKGFNHADLSSEKILDNINSAEKSIK